MSDTVINLYFHREQNGGSESNPEMPGVTPNPQEPEQNKDDEKGKGVNGKTLAVYMGKQAISMATSRVGTLTRSSAKQQQINNIMKTVGYTTAFVGSAITGNVTGMIMTALAVGVDIIGSTIDYNIGKRQESVALNISKERAGFNRSRK